MRIGLIDVDNHRIRNYRAKPFPDLARWSNHHALCNIPFAEYEPRKGFRCSRYLEEGGQP